MYRRKAPLLIFLVFTLILTGCWSRKELNEISPVIGLGVDKIGDHYVVSAQVVDPSESTPGGGVGRVPAVTYRMEAKSIEIAIRKLSTVAPRRLYFSHLRTFVIGESVAKEGIAPMLDIVSRNPEMRTDFYVILTKDTTANNVLSIVTPLEKVPAAFIYTMLKYSNKYWSPFVMVKLDDLDNDLASRGKHPVLPAIEIKGEQELAEQKKNVENISVKNYLQFTRLGVFHGDKLIGYLDENESSGYKFIVNKITETAVPIDCSEKQTDAVELKTVETTTNTEVIKEKPMIHIDVKAEANAAELQCERNLLDLKSLEQLEKQAEQTVERQIKQAVQAAQKKYKIDIFGFGRDIHQRNPRLWKKVKRNWDENFSTMPVDVHVSVKIRNFGKMNKSTPSNP
jgi:spore germination protein KC